MPTTSFDLHGTRSTGDHRETGPLYSASTHAVLRDTASKINDRRRDHKARALTTSDAITRAYHLGRFHAHRDDLDLLEGQL